MIGVINIKRYRRDIIALIITAFIIWNHRIDAGGDGRSYSIKINNETVSAYNNGVDVTEDFRDMEESAKEAIGNYYVNHKIEFVDFCHLGNTGSMTVDIILDECTQYTIVWRDEKIASINRIG